MNIKILIIIIIAVIVISAYAAVVGPSILYSIFHDPRSEHDLQRTWTDEKIIQNSDVIVMGELVGYEKPSVCCRRSLICHNSKETPKNKPSR